MSDIQTVAEKQADAPQKARSLAGDAWRDLRRNPIFWISLTLVVLVAAMAAFPSLFTSNDPRDCVLSRQHTGPSGGAIFGYDFQGCDTYSRAVYGPAPRCSSARSPRSSPA